MATTPPAFFNQIGPATKTSPFRGEQGIGGVYQQANQVLSGVTRDSTGAALAGCTVNVFVTATNAFVGTTLSDGSGNWSFTPSVPGPFFTVMYLAGATDVAGTSINTLVPV